MKPVNFQSAKILQKLGYKGEFKQWILPNEKYLSTEVYGYFKVEKYPAPRIDDVVHWIRNNYKYFIDIRYELKNWYYNVINMITNEVILSGADKISYEEALEDGVDRVLNYIDNSSDRKDIFKSARS